MRVTRRAWGIAAVGLFLVALGLLLERPLLLVGSALLGAWLIGYAYAFVQAIENVLSELDIEQSIEQDRVVADRRLAATLEATLLRPLSIHLDIESRPSPGTSVSAGGSTRIQLPPESTSGRSSYLVSWPHAGRYSFDAPAVTASDPLGIFHSSFALGPQTSITVSARAPRDLHVGAGGEASSGAYGEHPGDQLGAGLDPAEIRRYQPGDPASRIDWRATARLAEPHVREFEREVDLRTLLVVDHRGNTAFGPEGQAKFDYLREAALALLQSSRASDDPLACYTVGDEGITGQWGPVADRAHYRRIEDHLIGLAPTVPVGPHDATREIAPIVAKRRAGRLAGDDTAFGRTLRPYFEWIEPYVERVSGDPLYEAVRVAGEKIPGPAWTVMLTDDANPDQLRQAVGLARRGPGRVMVLMAPTVLFQPGGLADLETAYDRYVEFEEFRRNLDRTSGVDAYEVAPNDRVGAVLTAGRERRAKRGRPVRGG